MKLPEEPATTPEYISEYEYLARQWGQNWQWNLSALVSTYGWDSVDSLTVGGESSDEQLSRFRELASTLQDSFLYIWEAGDAVTVRLAEDDSDEQQPIKLRTYLIIQRIPLDVYIQKGIDGLLTTDSDARSSTVDVSDRITGPIRADPNMVNLLATARRSLDVASLFKDTDFRIVRMQATRRFGYFRGQMIHRNANTGDEAGPQTVYREQVTLLVRPDDRDLVLVEAEAPSVGATSHSVWIDDCLRNIKVVNLN